MNSICLIKIPEVDPRSKNKNKNVIFSNGNRLFLSIQVILFSNSSTMIPDIYQKALSRRVAEKDPNKIKVNYFLGRKNKHCLFDKETTIDVILQSILRDDFDETAIYEVEIDDDAVTSLEDPISKYIKDGAKSIDFTYFIKESENTINTYTIKSPKTPEKFGIDDLEENQLNTLFKVDTTHETGFLYSSNGTVYNFSEFNNQDLLSETFYFVKTFSYKEFQTYQEFYEQLPPTNESRQLLSIISYLDLNIELKKNVLKSIIQHSSFVPLICSAYKLYLRADSPMLKRKSFSVFFASLPAIFAEFPEVQHNYLHLIDLLIDQFDQSEFESLESHIEIRNHRAILNDTINATQLFEVETEKQIISFRDVSMFSYISPNFTLKQPCLITFLDDLESEVYAVFSGIDPQDNGQHFYKDLLNLSIEKTKRFDFTKMHFMSQVTAIYIDVSGSMRLAYVDGDMIMPRYKVAENIANSLIKSIREDEIFDPVLVYYGPNCQINEYPIAINPAHLSNTRTDICSTLNSIASLLCQDPYNHVEKRHIVIISDGIDHHKEERINSLRTLYEDKIIVDSIILHDDNQTTDPFTFGVYTGGVNFHPKSIDESMKAVENESFYNLDLRQKAPRPSKLPSTFPNLETYKYYSNYSQLQSNLNQFYIPSEKGLIRIPPTDSIDIETLNECEKEILSYLTDMKNPYIYLQRIDDTETFKPSILQHWCLFIPIGKNKPIYCQMIIDFPDQYPYALPKCRIISNPKYLLEKDPSLSEMLTIYGTIKPTWIKHLSDNALPSLLNSIIDKFSQIEFDLPNKPTDQFQQPIAEINELFLINMNIEI